MDLTPNREQLSWTALNYLIDQGVDVFVESIENVPDYYIYALSQTMTVEDIAKKYATTPEDIKTRIQRHIDQLFAFEEYIKASEEDLKNSEPES
jgi:hypothetical protein